MTGGNKKNLNEGGIKKLEKDSFTPPTISTANLNELGLSSIQKGIIKQISKKGNKFTIKGCAKVLNCDPKNIRYHLNKLQHIGFIDKQGEFGCWFLTDYSSFLLEGGNKKLELSRGGIKKLEKKPAIKQVSGSSSSPLREKAMKRKPPIKGVRLYKVEKETLRLYFEEFMTPEQIAKNRKVSLSAVYDTIERLKNKGFWRGEQKNLKKHRGGKGLTPSDNKFRLHAEQFYIKILDTTESFLKSIEKKGKDIIPDGNITVLYNSESVQIVSKVDFEAKTPMEAQAKSVEFWNNYILKLEQKLKVVLLKPGYNNIRYVKSGEYADTQNDIAKSYNNRKEKLMVRGTTDGKVWLHIDKSFNRDEFEYSHSERSLDDAVHLDETFEDLDKNFTGIEDTFNDIRDNFDIKEPFKASQVINMLGSLTTHVNKLQREVYNMNTELGASQKTSIEMFNNLIKVLSPTHRGQSSSGDKDDGNGFNPGDNPMYM